MRIKIPPKVTTGGEDPPGSLSPKKMEEWNKYVDWIEKKGYKGSKDLDKRETGLAKKLLEDYVKSNPGTELKYDDVKLVQEEMQKLKQGFQERAKRLGNPDADKIMKDVSAVDGWPGSQTTQFRFPPMIQKIEKDGQVLSNKNLGLMAGNMQPTGLTTNTQKKLPKGAVLEKLKDGWYYEDANSGDLIKWSEL